MKTYIKKNILNISVYCISIFISIAIIINGTPEQQIIRMLTTDKNADEHIWNRIHKFENNTISKKEEAEAEKRIRRKYKTG